MKGKVIAQRTAETPQGVEQALHTAIQKHQVVTMRYQKRSGEVVRRSIRPYEIKEGRVFATCDRHGPTKIHEFRLEAITIKPTKRPTVFVPVKEWP